MDLKENKSKVYCCVFGCKSSYGSDNVSSFHVFPEKGKQKVKIINKLGKEEVVDRYEAWSLKLKCGKKITKTMRVCSLHFLRSDYIPSCGMKKRHVLKTCAVPSQNLPQTPRHGTLKSPAKKKARVSHLKRNLFCEEEQVLRDREDEDMECVNENKENESTEESVEHQSIIDSYAGSNITVPDSTSVINLDAQIHLHQNKSIQVSEPFISGINNPKKLNTMTGLQSFEMLDCLVECARALRPDESGKLSMRERVILTLMKLKHNTSFVMLSCLFGNVTGTTCKNIFVDTIIILNIICSEAIPWPSGTATRNLLPICFEDFENVRIVLDCTENSVQRPKCLQCRIKVYSQYKSNFTIKFMTGVSPDGQITYVSKAYGGRASDKAIFEQSKLVESLEPNVDEVMVDKGFLIDTICDVHGINVVRPPHLRNKAQFSKEEALYTKNIAKARVHVERANQRIKIFKIFSGKFDWTLLPVIEDCFRVVCAIVNISTPILSDGRF